VPPQALPDLPLAAGPVREEAQGVVPGMTEKVLVQEFLDLRRMKLLAYLQPGVLAAVSRCNEGWCRLTDKRFVGWIEQVRLWGVYPDETIE